MKNKKRWQKGPKVYSDIGVISQELTILNNISKEGGFQQRYKIFLAKWNANEKYKK